MSIIALILLIIDSDLFFLPNLKHVLINLTESHQSLQLAGHWAFCPFKEMFLKWLKKGKKKSSRNFKVSLLLSHHESLGPQAWHVF